MQGFINPCISPRGIMALAVCPQERDLGSGIASWWDAGKETQPW